LRQNSIEHDTVQDTFPPESAVHETVHFGLANGVGLRSSPFSAVSASANACEAAIWLIAARAPLASASSVSGTSKLIAIGFPMEPPDDGQRLMENRLDEGTAI
jgi:hypothetical protein